MNTEHTLATDDEDFPLGENPLDAWYSDLEELPIEPEVEDATTEEDATS